MVPWSSRRARPEGVWRRVGRGFGSVDVVVEGGWRVIVVEGGGIFGGGRGPMLILGVVLLVNVVRESVTSCINFGRCDKVVVLSGLGQRVK